MTLLHDLFALDGQVALVPGASRGIGAAIARGLAEAGATVIGAGRSVRPDEDLDKAAYRSLDVAAEGAAEALVAEVVATHGRLDILVNALGISLGRRPGMSETERFAAQLRINLDAVFRLCLAAAPEMEKAGGGSIVNVTSIASAVGLPDNPGYLASKGGLRQLTRSLAYDLGPKGIRANNLAPGYVRTAMTEESYADPARHDQRLRHTLLRRWGTPDDMVGAAIFLASPASAYVTGQDLFVDGGWTANGMTPLEER
jgi:gluconate 5-dehydrogenase